MNDGGGAGDGRFDGVCYCWSFGKPNVVVTKGLNWGKEERRRLVVTSA